MTDDRRRGYRFPDVDSQKLFLTVASDRWALSPATDPCGALIGSAAAVAGQWPLWTLATIDYRLKRLTSPPPLPPSAGSHRRTAARRTLAGHQLRFGTARRP